MWRWFERHRHRGHEWVGRDDGHGGHQRRGGDDGCGGDDGQRGDDRRGGGDGQRGDDERVGCGGDDGRGGNDECRGTRRKLGRRTRRGSAGTTGGAGTGGSVTPHGSAAKFICPQGVAYGNPLTGVGQVMQIAAPTGDPTPITYFAFVEGPVWIGSAGTGTLFFSDNASSPQERIYKVVPPATVATTAMDMSGSNGLAVGNANEIVVADQRNRRITRVNPSNGMMTGTIASTTAKPNDVIVRSDDNVYFSDPDTGFFRISPSGTVSAAMKPTQGSRPNGIVLSPDENTLYVGDVGNQTITKYTLGTDGTVMTGTAANLITGNGNKTMADTQVREARRPRPAGLIYSEGRGWGPPPPPPNLPR